VFILSSFRSIIEIVSDIQEGVTEMVETNPPLKKLKLNEGQTNYSDTEEKLSTREKQFQSLRICRMMLENSFEVHLL
jgi:hypothetical protein